MIYDMIWYDIWYGMIWYDIWYDMIWYDIWYDMMIGYDMMGCDVMWYMIWYMTWHDMTRYNDICYMIYNTIWYMIWYMIRYMIWYMIWYDTIYFLTASGLTAGGSSTVHIYTQTIHRTLYAFFWVIPRRLNFICRRFGTLCLLHLHRQVGMNIQNKAKVWNEEYFTSMGWKLQEIFDYSKKSASRNTTFRTRRKFEIKSNAKNNTKQNKKKYIYIEQHKTKKYI